MASDAQRICETGGRGQRKKKEGSNEVGDAGDGGNRIVQDNGSPPGLAFEDFEVFLNPNGALGSCPQYVTSSMTVFLLSGDIGDVDLPS